MFSEILLKASELFYRRTKLAGIPDPLELFPTIWADIVRWYVKRIYIYNEYNIEFLQEKLKTADSESEKWRYFLGVRISLRELLKKLPQAETVATSVETKTYRYYDIDIKVNLCFNPKAWKFSDTTQGTISAVDKNVLQIDLQAFTIKVTGPTGFQYYLLRLQDTLKHELVHARQLLWRQGLRTKYELPEYRSYNLELSGREKYYLHEKEFYPWVQLVVHYITALMSNSYEQIPKHILKEIVKYLCGEPAQLPPIYQGQIDHDDVMNFFSTLKKHNLPAWKKAVQEVSKALDL